MISNEEALENLLKQREQIIDQLNNGQTTLMKIEGAIEVLQQLSEVEEEPQPSFDQGGEVPTDFGEEATLSGE
jgi:hypothetical protein